VPLASFRALAEEHGWACLDWSIKERYRMGFLDRVFEWFGTRFVAWLQRG
jgi:hypothetical protein